MKHHGFTSVNQVRSAYTAYHSLPDEQRQLLVGHLGADLLRAFRANERAHALYDDLASGFRDNFRTDQQEGKLSLRDLASLESEVKEEEEEEDDDQSA